jgi:hypothetical protein
LICIPWFCCVDPSRELGICIPWSVVFLRALGTVPSCVVRMTRQLRRK